MTGSGPVGVGVIGAGFISDQYLATMAGFPDLDIRFIADIDPAAAEHRAELHGVPAWGTVAELLDRSDVEVVVNLTTPAAHVAVARQVIDSGKHVWSEKPFSLDRESGRQLLAAARAAGLRVACAPDTVLGIGFQTGRRVIDDGAIGRPLTAVAYGMGPGPASWHPNPEFLYAAGAGPLFDMGPYYLTALVQIFGPVSEVTGAASRARDVGVIGSGPRAGSTFEIEVPTRVNALIRFESGASAQLGLSFQSQLIKSGVLEVEGEAGTVVLPHPNNFDGSTSVWTGPNESRTIEVDGSGLGRGLGVVELARAIRAGVPERASGELAFHVVDIMVSIDESARELRPVSVESTVERTPALPVEWDPTASTL